MAAEDGLLFDHIAHALPPPAAKGTGKGLGKGLGIGMGHTKTPDTLTGAGGLGLGGSKSNYKTPPVKKPLSSPPPHKMNSSMSMMNVNTRRGVGGIGNNKNNPPGINMKD